MVYKTLINCRERKKGLTREWVFCPSIPNGDDEREVKDGAYYNGKD